ncbi:MAG TPA: hypothetical protein VMM82_09925 [Spirochaetia bacterium]|nr:hypothetical protein [Spirochaetia bacterium]
MKITQPDSRTIKVVTESGTIFFLPYRFSWNGHDREPASVVLETSGSGQKTTAIVKVFFLFGMVEDRIRADAAGVVITRSWNVMTPGSVKILLDVEFDLPEDTVCFFPGVAVGKGLPSRPVSFLAGRTSYPGAIILGLGNEAVVVFSRSAWSQEDAASIGVSRVEREEESSRLRVEVRFPGVEAPTQRTGPRPEHQSRPEDPVIQCAGTLTRSHELCLSFSARKDILAAAPAAVLKRFSIPARNTGAKSGPDPAGLSKAARQLLSTHLVESGSVTGLRETPGSPWLSSQAGLALSVSLRKLFPRDQGLGETALRLADFSLRGQLPSGLFYGSYHLDDHEWRGVKGRPGRAALSIPQSARIADLLLLLAEVLREQDLPFEKYFLAGQRFVDVFVDDKGKCALPGDLWPPDRADQDWVGWSILFPVGRVLDRLGKDRYKKALGVIAARFAAAPWDVFSPPSSRIARDCDSAASLLAVRMFLELRGRGFHPGEPPGSSASAKSKSGESVKLFASFLLPWIRIHGNAAPRQGSPSGQSVTTLDGALVDSFLRQRLVFAGNEAAYLLRQLATLAGSGDLKSLLSALAGVCRSSGSDFPQGTAFYQHALWDQEGREGAIGKTGPVDSRRLADEILYGVMSAGGPRSTRAARSSGQSARGGRSRKPSGKP